MSGVYGRSQSPLKSGFPSTALGVGPSGGFGAAGPLPVPWPYDGTANTTKATPVAILLKKCMFTSNLLENYSALGVSAEPAKTFWPLGSVTERALQVFDPSFARNPSIEIVSPSFSASLVQPLRVNVLGGPPSHCQRTIFPLSSFASI